MTLVREAMLIEPRALGVDASAQEAGGLLANPDVRAVFVCDEHRLVGVVTRKTLVREVVAPGLDPQKTPLGEIGYRAPREWPRQHRRGPALHGRSGGSGRRGLPVHGRP